MFDMIVVKLCLRIDLGETINCATFYFNPFHSVVFSGGSNFGLFCRNYMSPLIHRDYVPRLYFVLFK